MDQEKKKEELALWHGFYLKSLYERQAQIALCYPDLLPSPLDPILADSLIENCIGVLGLPLGLGINLSVNNETCLVPIATEEPSIIAALSGSAKTIGNLIASASESNSILAQILLTHHKGSSIDMLNTKKDELITIANTFLSKGMLKRGGKVLDIQIQSTPNKTESKSLFPPGFLDKQEDWITLVIEIAVGEAMGANIATTVAEGLAPFVEDIFSGKAAVKIVSNYSIDATTSSFSIPIDRLDYKGVSGRDLATRIVQANSWACDDPMRAVTHNKGIMNGIDGVLVATGQDYRAIEANVHLFASKDGSYKPLTQYWIEKTGKSFSLCGSISIPLSVGVKGGVIQSNPTYKYTLGLLSNPSSARLKCILASVGLAQNFAALRALVSEGITRGHLALHSQSIAISAGVPLSIIPECVAWMKACGRTGSKDCAKEFLLSRNI